ARSGGVPVHSPKRAQLAAFVRAEPLYTLDIARWENARQPIADAMAAAIAPWLPYITPFDLTSEEAMPAVQHEPLVREVSAAFEAWLARAGEHPTYRRTMSQATACASVLTSGRLARYSARVRRERPRTASTHSRRVTPLSG